MVPTGGISTAFAAGACWQAVDKVGQAGSIQTSIIVNSFCCHVLMETK